MRPARSNACVAAQLLAWQPTIYSGFCLIVCLGAQNHMLCPNLMYLHAGRMCAGGRKGHTWT